MRARWLSLKSRFSYCSLSEAIYVVIENSCGYCKESGMNLLESGGHQARCGGLMVLKKLLFEFEAQTEAAEFVEKHVE